MLRDCTGCSACCEGNLMGIAHGNPFGPRPCVFLDGQQCGIYDTRPGVCAKYQCAWTQNLFDDIIQRPSDGNMLISVEQKDNKQYLKLIKMGAVDTEAVEYLDEWARKNNTYIQVVEKK